MSYRLRKAPSCQGTYQTSGSEIRNIIKYVTIGNLFLEIHFDELRGRAGALVLKMRLERLLGVVMNH